MNSNPIGIRPQNSKLKNNDTKYNKKLTTVKVNKIEIKTDKNLPKFIRGYYSLSLISYNGK